MPTGVPPPASPPFRLSIKWRSTGNGLKETRDEFELFWIGNEIEGARYKDAEIAFFDDILTGVVSDQGPIDRIIDKTLAADWPLARIDSVMRAILRAGAYELKAARRHSRACLHQGVCRCRRRVFWRRRSRNDQCGAGRRGAPVPCGGIRTARVGFMNRPSEDELIATYFAPLAGPGAFGLRDDAAIVAQKPGQDIVATKDLLIAGVHFFADDPPGAVARKALRVNLSDLAAKGAEPCGFLLGLALPEDWTAALARGLRARARRGRRGLQMSAARRRHREESWAAHHLDHRDRQRPGAKNGSARGRRGGRPHLCDRDHWGRRLGASIAHRRSAKTRMDGNASPKRTPPISPAATFCRSPRLCLREALAPMRMRPWTFQTDLPAILPKCCA